jgi:glycosyltransferase involved in cell wall biosynthesis
MGAGLKPSIVVSGVNLVDMGPLAIFKDALTSLASEYSDTYDIIALVHKTALFGIAGIQYIEYPKIKSSWWKRLRFEYFDCRRISERLHPYLWLAMHDMTPSVSANLRVVYCHNPAPFYSLRIEELWLDPIFSLHALFYRFLYGINIKANSFVVVQQDWMRSEFRLGYGVCDVVVAHPSVEHLASSLARNSIPTSNTPYIFFYPAYPRSFKNMEQILNAARRLESEGSNQFEIWLTLDGTENRYAAKTRRQYSDLTTVRWLGLLPREEVMRRYTKADCLIFPSRLETWGMPITEFKITGKLILAANLPYAHETVGNYGQAGFFDLGDDLQLSKMMKQAVDSSPAFGPVTSQEIAQPFSQNWQELWQILLQK